jgi:lipopolysaccharide/colanic/teichoic acid biosynthesis glycosyltransferase
MTDTPWTELSQLSQFCAVKPSTSRLATLHVKRTIDFSLAFLLLVLLAPLLFIVAGIVLASSRGPILFRQKRRGLNGKEFVLLKFRSMYVDHEHLLSDQQKKDFAQTGILPKSNGDKRITPAGRILRRTSIDELPQLVNVLLGHMSLVGPRPIHEGMLRPYPEIAQARTLVRPGITGLWQVEARESNTSVLYMWPYDKRYIEELNLAMDIRILVATFGVVVSGKGAY